MERTSLIWYCDAWVTIAPNPSPESLTALLRDALETERSNRRENVSKVTGAEEPRRHNAGQGMLLPGSGLSDRGWSAGLERGV
jgi:hypothetical protein